MLRTEHTFSLLFFIMSDIISVPAGTPHQRTGSGNPPSRRDTNYPGVAQLVARLLWERISIHPTCQSQNAGTP